MGERYQILSQPCWFAKFLSLKDRFVRARTVLQYPEGVVQTVDLSAVHHTENVPVILVPGWGNSHLEQYGKVLFSLAEKRRTIGFSSPHGIGIEHAENCFSDSDIKSFSSVYLRKTAAFFEAVRFHNLSKIDAVGYSEGALIIAIAATLRPQMFRNVIFVNPAGTLGKTHPVLFLARYLLEVVNGSLCSLKSGSFFKKVSHIAGGHMQRIFSEPKRAKEDLYAAARANLFSEIHIPLRAGVKFAAVIAKDDMLFPPCRFRESVPPNIFHEVREMPGRHSNFIYDGADYLNEMFAAMED
jgi:pimeloyl-ACP methyl ester carboxylesterase